MHRTALACTSIATLGLITAAALVTAGPLDPPAGPVGSTLKTLTEVEPRTAISAANTPGDADSLFRITQPGSYYLTGNITGVAGKHGIEIAASGVTLDLNGFDLAGTTGMGAFDGVTSLGISFTNITVMNGTIRNWGGDGVEIVTVGRQVGRVQGVLATANVGRGIFVSSGTLADCSALANGGLGIEVGAASSVVDCIARDNVGGGFRAADSTSLAGCAAYENSGIGFLVTDACQLSRCIARGNLGLGFLTGETCAIEACNASDNAGGGIQVDDGSTVVSTIASSNSLSGIVAANSAMIASCTAIANTADGIRVFNRCDVRANVCGGTSGVAPIPGSTGIHVVGVDNRIERNTLIGVHRGLDVDFSGNLIIANAASANTINWDISATNLGQFVNATNGGAFAGSTGGAPIGSTDPWVNFSY